MTTYRLLEDGVSRRLLEDGVSIRLTEAVGGAPDAPTIGTATKGNAQVSITFTPPSNVGDSPIIDYTALASTGESVTGSGSPLVITGMVNGVAATITVTARNAQGSSSPSAASNSVTPSTIPSAPTGVTAIAGDGQAAVSFSSGGDGGAAITNYTVTSSPGSFTASGAASPLTVTGLANGTPYTFTVVATNSNGDSAVSSPSSAVTPQAAYWTDDFSSFANFTNITNSFAAVSGKAVPQSTGNCLAIWDQLNDSIAHSPDYSVSASVYKSSTDNATMGVIGRYYKVTDTNCYLALVRASTGTDSIQLYKIVEGTATQLGSTVSQEWVDGDTLTLTMIGNTISLLVNGTSLISVTDGTFNNVVGQAGLRASFGTTGGLDNFSVVGEGVGVVHHTSGGVTDTTAKIAFSLSGAGSVQVEYSVNSDMSSSSTSSALAVTSTTNYCGAITLTGLTANTTYYYRLLVDSVVKQFTPFARTKTVATAAGSLKLGFGSCGWMFDADASGTPTTLPEAFLSLSQVGVRAPDLFVWNGDVGYADNRESGGTVGLAEFRERYRFINSNWTRGKTFADLRRLIPSVYNWDNHEQTYSTGLYDADAAQAFGEYFQNPTPYRSGTNYYVVRVRDVEVFVTDGLRYQSAYTDPDNSSKTKLGLTQKQDLKDWLYTSTARIKIIVSTTSVDPWGNSFTGDRAWGVGYTNELYQIWDFIQTQRISGVLWITGDNHYHALFKTTRLGRNNYSFCVSPLNQYNITAPAGASTDPDTVFLNDTEAQIFGLLTLNTSASPPTLQIDAIDETNTVVNTSSITLTTLDNNLTAAAVPATPTSVTASNSGSTSATVSGAMPLNNGAAITSLVAISTPGGITGSVVPSSQIGSYSILVEGLTPATAYTFVVHAINSVGTGSDSAASNEITTSADSGTTGFSTNTGLQNGTGFSGRTGF